MKTITKIIFMTVIFINFAFAADPDYEINISNITNINANSLQFDIYLKHTNPLESEFHYSMGQFMLDFNGSIANGGMLSYTYAPTFLNSELPPDIRPVNPTLVNDELRLFAQPNGSPWNGFTISSNGNGTLIARMKLSTTASSFSGSPNLSVRNSNSGGFYTKVCLFDEYSPGLFKIKNITKKESVKKYLDLRYSLEAMYPVLDSVKIRIRKAVPTYDAVDSQTVFSSLDGTHFRAVAGFINLQPGMSYYIEAVHRNSIATWSANPKLFSSDTISYDFSSSVSQAYNGNMINISGVASIYSGDVNQDGFVDLSDVNKIFNDAGNFVMGYVNTDLSGDEIVDLTDLNIAYNNSSNFIQVKKPF